MKKNTTKKVAALLMILALSAGLMAGCADKKEEKKEEATKTEQKADDKKKDAEEKTEEKTESQSGAQDSYIVKDGDSLNCKGVIKIYNEKELDEKGIQADGYQYAVILEFPKETNFVYTGSQGQETGKTKMLVLDRILNPTEDGWDKYDGRRVTLRAAISGISYPTDDNGPVGLPRCTKYDFVRG